MPIELHFLFCNSTFHGILFHIIVQEVSTIIELAIRQWVVVQLQKVDATFIKKQLRKDEATIFSCGYVQLQKVLQPFHFFV